MPKRVKKDKKVGSIRHESVTEKYYGLVKVEKWPEDLDEFLEKQIIDNALEKLNWYSRN